MICSIKASELLDNRPHTGCIQTKPVESAKWKSCYSEATNAVLRDGVGDDVLASEKQALGKNKVSREKQLKQQHFAASK